MPQRHLAEFWMVEPEIAFGDIQDVMNCAVAYVRFLCQWLLGNCLDDLEFMVKNLDKSAIDRPRMVSSTKFVRISYTEAVAILDEALKERQFENIVEWGIDLASEHERFLTKVKFKSPVIVYDYSKGIKVFYMKVNPDDKAVAAMGVLVPKESSKSGLTTAANHGCGGKERICGEVLQVPQPCKEDICNAECLKKFPTNGKSQCGGRGYCSGSQCSCFHPCPPIRT